MRDNSLEELTDTLRQIQANSVSDFLALALPDDQSGRYRWYCARGNLNERYKQMLVKRGKGVPGMALLLGRSIAQDGRLTDKGSLMIDCPLMWAESLQAAAATPITATGGIGDIGVVIIGKRSPYRYTKDDLTELQHYAKQLSSLCESVQPKILR